MQPVLTKSGDLKTVKLTVAERRAIENTNGLLTVLGKLGFVRALNASTELSAILAMVNGSGKIEFGGDVQSSFLNESRVADSEGESRETKPDERPKAKPKPKKEKQTESAVAALSDLQGDEYETPDEQVSSVDDDFGGLGIDDDEYENADDDDDANADSF